MAKLRIEKCMIAQKDNDGIATPEHISKLVNKTDKKNKAVINPRKDEYYLASMFPNDDVMHRVYSIIRKLEEA